MTLNELKKGESATICHIEADKSLKTRLNSFGITKGATINVEEYTMGKNTIEISIKRTKVALRLKEASNIEVEKC
ncbi:MAG: FeoA family protein [Candidatus Marinarcus sp.]|uniref:FeoA family protein n=1 Tax=Candidatus Marinarcus sp. TaxID=3100987 RepID=UPI003B00BC9D